MPREERKRKAREKLAPKMDTTKPISLEDLGGADDPCFGKLNDPRVSECQRCGDSELCAIAMAQLNNISRAVIEKKGNFKDIEEQAIKPPMDKSQARKAVRKRIYEMVERAGEEGVDEEVILIDVFMSFKDMGWRKYRVRKYLKKLAERKLPKPRIKIRKNKIIWKQ